MRGRTLRLSCAVLEAALAAALAVALVSCSAPKAEKADVGAATSGEPIRIGVVVSLTGNYAGLGEPEKATLEMETERINASGGVKGRPIELIFEDDATDEAKAAAAASKLIEQDRVVAVIGATGSGQTMAMRGDIDRAEVVQVSMAGATAITNPLDPLVFATPWSNTIVVPFELAALSDAGIKRIAVISDSGGFGKDGLAVLQAQAPKSGIEIVSSQTFNPGDSDMSAQLTKIKGSDAQALVMWTAGKEAATVVKNAADLDVGLPIYGSHGNARAEFIAGAGEAAEGVRIAAGKILVPETYGTDTEAYKIATDFVARFTKETGNAPSTFAGHAYDALHLITEAASRVDGDLTSKALRDEIEKTSGFVGMGGTFTFSTTDHNGMTAHDLTLYEVKDGAWSVIK